MNKGFPFLFAVIAIALYTGIYVVDSHIEKHEFEFTATVDGTMTMSSFTKDDSVFRYTLLDTDEFGKVLVRSNLNTVNTLSEHVGESVRCSYYEETIFGKFLRQSDYTIYIDSTDTKLYHIGLYKLSEE